MGRTSDKDRVRKWQSRVNSAEKAYKFWAIRFDTDYLERLYIGEHHDDEKKYTINLCFPSVETRLSMMTMDRPYIRVEAKSPRSDDQGSNIEARARLREDTVNCFVADETVGFIDTTSLGVKEAHYRFAMAEIVYSNDFIDNPNADKPLLDEGGNDTGSVQPPKVPKEGNGPHEWVKVKRIPPQNFRISLNAKNTLEENDWCGYFEWHQLTDVKANPNYSNTASLQSSGKIKPEYADPTPEGKNESRDGMVKLWKLWDIRAQKRYVFTDGGEKFLLEEDYDIFPFAALKFHELSDEWYPLPPMFNWRDPQKSINETRDAQNAFLAQAYLKFLYADGAIEESELNKLSERKWGVYAKTSGSRAFAETLFPVAQPPLDASFWRNVPQSKEDFIQISAVSSEQRGVPDSNTATQAQLVDINSKRREIKDASKVANWMADIARILLETIEKRMALPYWVKTNVDITGPNALQEAAGIVKTWKEITSKELGDLVYEVTVDVESLSPLTEDTKRQQWMNVLGLLNNPVLVMALMSSDVLLKRTLGYFGIKSDRDVQEVKQAFQSVINGMQQMQQQQAQAKAGQQGGGMEQMMSQLAGQLGQGGMPQ